MLKCGVRMLLVSLLVMPCAVVSAQEVSVVSPIGGGVSESARIQTLKAIVQSLVESLRDVKTDVEELEDDLEVSNDLLVKVNFCQAKEMFYAPSRQGADADGCAPSIVETLRNPVTKVVETSRCYRGGVRSVIARCPSGYTLSGCSGGAGDMSEKGEGAFVRPLNSTTCQLYVGEPRCSSGEPWSYQKVFAYCVKY